jgi:hypothetical protein
MLVLCLGCSLSKASSALRTASCTFPQIFSGTDQILKFVSLDQLQGLFSRATKNQLATTSSGRTLCKWRARRSRPALRERFLELIPQILVIDVVVVLHLGRFYERAQQACAAIGRRLFQVRIATLNVIAH